MNKQLSNGIKLFEYLEKLSLLIRMLEKILKFFRMERKSLTWKTKVFYQS